MNDFKEWLSDYLIYFLIGAGLLGVLLITLLGVGIYKLANQTPEPTSQTEIIAETESEASSETESETMTERLSEAESETMTGRLSETESETMTGRLSETESETLTERLSEAESEALTERLSEEESEPLTGALSKTENEPMTGELSETEIERAPETERESAAEPETGSVPETEGVWMTEAPAEQSPVYLTMKEACYIRTGPGYEYDIITTYEAGTVVEFLDDAGGWYHVRVDGITGYMGARFF
ncbi:MAG: SH3 domain-containing protein [Candidatus Limivivens sp.]|nr:SH3 domain-containing protein [Candidatus Limivivens sp.]